MVSVAAFIRNTPAPALRSFFESVGFETIVPDWTVAANHLVGPLSAAVESTKEDARARFFNAIERVTAMADEAGQAALYAVVQNRNALDRLENGHDRALSILRNDPDAFRRAEEVRFADERRRGRMWAGYKGESGIDIRRGADAIDRFKEAVLERFETNHVQVDIFDRHRPSFEGEAYEVVQATVYRDGRPDDVLEFVNDMLDRRPRRPVYEAALTYEPASGVIEVVANVQEHRQDFARLFAEELLGIEFKQERLPWRRYDLTNLLKPYDFSTDPEDGVESVRVNLLRLMPLDTVGERVTLESGRGASQTIWDMADEHFGSDNPLLGGWIITQAKLSIRFHPEEASRRMRTLPLTITMPHGCDLKDRTERERLIGDKYLRRWGIVGDD